MGPSVSGNETILNAFSGELCALCAEKTVLTGRLAKMWAQLQHELSAHTCQTTATTRTLKAKRTNKAATQMATYFTRACVWRGAWPLACLRIGRDTDNLRAWCINDCAQMFACDNEDGVRGRPTYRYAGLIVGRLSLSSARSMVVEIGLNLQSVAVSKTYLCTALHMLLSVLLLVYDCIGASSPTCSPLFPPRLHVSL